MKRLLLFLLSILILYSCNKYEEGPAFSLLSKKARLANTWMVDRYYGNGVDRTFEYRAIFTSERLTIFKSGTWQYTDKSTWTWVDTYNHGFWSLEDDKETLQLVYENSLGPPAKYRILRLKSKELWLEKKFNNDSTAIYHYIPAND